MVSNGVPAPDPQRTSIDTSGHVSSDPRVRRRLRNHEVSKVRSLVGDPWRQPFLERLEEDPSIYHIIYDKLEHDIRRRITGRNIWF